ncbi:Hypothetical predicted protein [Pelobates cultripes]|uniref:Uncharacterized protein n=1 Tax=Pelobates cultripes TaxID=61616 RepID=A0AAD1TR91_PELCU|nr:Hypothetical predicted protein [Pelobates cultripes]
MIIMSQCITQWWNLILLVIKPMVIVHQMPLTGRIVGIQRLIVKNASGDIAVMIQVSLKYPGVSSVNFRQNKDETLELKKLSLYHNLHVAPALHLYKQFIIVTDWLYFSSIKKTN